MKGPIIFIMLGVFMLVVGVIAGASLFTGSATVKDPNGVEVPSYKVQCTVTIHNPLLFGDLQVESWNCDYVKANCPLLSMASLSFLGAKDEGIIRISVAGIAKEQDYSIWETTSETYTETFPCVPEGKTQFIVTLISTDKTVVKQESHDLNIIR